MTVLHRLLIGGGIGSGKSTVGRILRDRGVIVIDADKVGHRVLEPDGASFAAVMHRWPSVVKDGRIDRGALARIVFSDPAELADLEALTHSAIASVVEGLVATASTAIVAVEIPLVKELLGGRWLRVFVDAPEHLRRRRLHRGHKSSHDIGRRMAAQPSRDEWLAWADRVIANDGDRRSLARQVDQVLAELLG